MRAAAFCLLTQAALAPPLASQGVLPVRAVLDSAGRLHFNGRVFEAAAPAAASAALQITGCQRGASATVYVGAGGDARTVALSAELPPGGWTLVHCADTLGDTSAEGLAGHIVLRCGPGGEATAEAFCGCARRPVVVPLVPENSTGRPQRPGSSKVVWPRAAILADGEVELRSCAELAQGPLVADTSWALRCDQGLLMAEVSGCWQARLEAAPLAGTELASGRRLAVPCAPVIADYWWPTICASLVAQPIETIAGAHGRGSAPDQLNKPGGIYVDRQGSIIIADSGNNRIQKWLAEAWALDSTGTTVAGSVNESASAVDSSKLKSPQAVVIAGSCEDLVIAEPHFSRILTWQEGASDGIIAVGGDVGAGSGDNQVNEPQGVYATEDLDIYIADTQNSRVVRWERVGGSDVWQPVVGAYAAGTGTAGSSSTELNKPKAVWVDSQKNVFVADTGNNRILRVPPVPPMPTYPATTTTLGPVSQVASSLDGCTDPVAVFVDSYGSVYAACESKHCVMRWDDIDGTSYGSPVVVAGVCGTSVDALEKDTISYASSVTKLNQPSGVFVTTDGSVYVSDSLNDRVMRYAHESLTQWVVANSDTSIVPFSLVNVVFYTDIDCSNEASSVRSIAYDGKPAASEYWSPSCLKEGRCDAGQAWFGSLMTEAHTVRCVSVLFNSMLISEMAFSVQYWTGLRFKTNYVFGGVVNNTITILRPPRFNVIEPSCVKGAFTCVLTDITGDWQSLNDRIMVKSDNCDSGLPVSGFPRESRSYAATHNGTRFVFGDTSQSAWISVDASSGASYLLCWCDSKIANCMFQAEFPLFIDFLRIQGPKGQQEKETWRGQPLVITDLLGVDLAQDDRLAVASDVCGPQASAVLGFPTPDGLRAISDPSPNGLKYTFGDGLVTATPGSYILCWCRPVGGSQCSTLPDMRATAGTLRVSGPLAGQNFVCIAGRGCTFSMYGLNLNVGDSVMILSQCGSGTLVEGFPQPKGTNSVQGGARTFSWGPERVLTPAGLHLVCWCAVQFTCDTAENYRAEVGILSIVGPSSTDFKCALGLPCSVKAFGVSLEDGDRLRVLAKSAIANSFACSPGAAGHPGFVGESAAYPGVSAPATDGGSNYEWGVVAQALFQGSAIGAVPETYVVCWCKEMELGSTCLSANNFLTELGTVLVTGPIPDSESHSCRAGRVCQVTIKGEDLGENDVMVIVADGRPAGQRTGSVCGIAGAELAKKDTLTEAARSTSVAGNLHLWQIDQLPYGGGYWMCWCANDEPDTRCNEMADFAVSAGEITIQAPIVNVEAVTCTSGSTCPFNLTGFGLMKENKVALFDDSCEDGIGNLLPGLGNGGLSDVPVLLDDTESKAMFIFGSNAKPISTNGGKFKACWCGDECASKFDFFIEVGDVTIIGPYNSQAFVCWQRLPCSIGPLEGEGLSNGDRLLVISNRVACNGAPAGGVPNGGYSLRATGGGSVYSWGDDVLRSSPQRFSLCWCAASQSCIELSSEYVTRTGLLTVAGPNSGQGALCFLGSPCSISSILGLELQDGDRLIIKESCEMDAVVDGSPVEAWEGTRCVNAVSGECLNFQVPPSVKPTYKMMMKPRVYRMCWCPVVSGNCDDIAASSVHFALDVGVFTAAGPYDKQEFTCAIGFPCAMRRVTGLQLGDGDRWFVRSPSWGSAPLPDAPLPCSTAAVLSADGLPNNGVSKPATNSGLTVELDGSLGRQYELAGKYVLCWCPMSGACDMALDLGIAFAARIGLLTIAGPRPLEKDVNCAIEEKCEVNGVVGVGLKNGDRILVVKADSECGPGAIPAENFPGSGVSSRAESDGSRFVYNEKLSSKTGGSYRICWCGYSLVLADTENEQAFECVGSDDLFDKEKHVGDYLIDIGTLKIPGKPMDNFGFLCNSGMPCKVEGISSDSDTGLVDGSQIVVRQSEATAQVSDGRRLTDGVCTSLIKSADGFPGGAESNSATMDGANYGWGTADEIITTQGGIYTLCWKAPISSNFQFLVGTLTVNGPAGGQTFNCTMRAECNLQTIAGVGLAQGDRVRVVGLDGCGTEDIQASGISGSVRMSSPAAAKWSKDQFDPPQPGTYFLCWCQDGNYHSQCANTVDFATTIGTLEVRGPIPGQNRKCNRGQTCTITCVEGWFLEANDKAKLLVECGTSKELDGFENAVATAVATTSSEGVNLFSYTWRNIRPAPNIYRVCWEAAGVTSEFESFDVEVGVITLQGPKDIPELQVLIYGHMWEPTVEGVNSYLFQKSELRILHDCSVAAGGVLVANRTLASTPVANTLANGESFVFSAQNMTLLTPQKAGGAYKLCWCRGYLEPSENDCKVTTASDCNSVEDFGLLIADIDIVCGAGKERLGEGCQECALGSYKSLNDNSPCLRCPEEAQTTASTGITSREDCKCKPMYYVGDKNVCEFCPPNKYCLGMEEEANSRDCPVGSGSWPAEDCPSCKGHYPAKAISDCSCKPGYMPDDSGRFCKPCSKSWYKNVPGNGSCALCSDSTMGIGVGAGTNSTGATECDCGPGWDVVRNPLTQTPLYCNSCPKSFYCDGFGDPTKCTSNSTTPDIGASSKEACECGPGYYPLNAECKSCPAGGVKYKDASGNYECDKSCPEHATIPESVLGGARGIESCMCDSNYTRLIDESTGAFTCIEQEADASIAVTSARVPSVTSNFSFSKVNPELVGSQLDQIRLVVAQQLGLETADTVKVDIVSISRRLTGKNVSNATNGSNVSSVLEQEAEPDAPGTYSVTIAISVWQSTYIEAETIRNALEGAGVAEALEDKLSAYISFEYFTLVPAATDLEYVTIVCPNLTAIPVNTFFQSPDESCACIFGYEPWESTGDEAEVIGHPRCRGCRNTAIGYYKSVIGNQKCTPCNSEFASTVPISGATSETHCICPPGSYRDPTKETGFQCLPCPVGFYCAGDYVKNVCPEKSTTTSAGKAIIDDCKCIKGYFRGLDTGTCLPCDTGYYKPDIGDGSGRCELRCLSSFGALATSDLAATIVDDCYCNKDSFMAEDDQRASGYWCTACDNEGVICLGGFDSGTRNHTPPVATVGFDMIYVKDATVARCRTNDEIQGSVCRGENECLEGHTSLICGTCAKEYTRDRYPSPCRSCGMMLSTTTMVLQIMLELTVQSLWNEFLTIAALMKTETQNNIFTVMWRMYTHWSCQIAVVSQYKISRLRPISETSGNTAAAAVLAVGSNSSDASATTADGFVWPTWHQAIMSVLIPLQSAIPTVFSTQETLECMMERQLSDYDDSTRKMMKLVMPAVFWLFYPPLTIAWVIMLAYIQSRLFVPLYQLVTGEDWFAGIKKDGKGKGKDANGTGGDGDDDSSDSDENESSSSSSSDPKAVAAANDKAVRIEPTPKQWDKIGRAMNYLVIQPERFRRLAAGNTEGKESKPRMVEKEEESDKLYFLQLLRPGVSIYETVADIMPWMVISLNNIWLPVTIRMLQMNSCEPFQTSGQKGPYEPRLMMSTQVVCSSLDRLSKGGVQSILFIISLSGILAWSVGIVILFMAIITNIGLSTPFIQRTFGYLLEGYEPRSWWWEIVWKKTDLLVVALITYTSIAVDERAKLILYAIWSLIVLMVQISYSPYDNRQIDLLDRIEKLGLYVRCAMFVGIAFYVVFGPPRFITLTIAATIVVGTLAYLLKLAIHLADDWINGQSVNIDRMIATALKEHWVELKKKAAAIRTRELVRNPDQLSAVATNASEEAARAEDACQAVKAKGGRIFAPDKGKGKLLNLYRGVLDYLQKVMFSSYRSRQLQRFRWHGPNSDARLYRPALAEGAPAVDELQGEKMPLWMRWQLQLPRFFFNLDGDKQLTFAVENITGFLHLLIFTANFEQIPARLTDMIMLLAVGVRRRRHEMIFDPAVVKKRKKKSNEGAAGKNANVVYGKSATVAVTLPVVNKSAKSFKEDEGEDELDEDSEDDQAQHAPVRCLKALMLEEILMKQRGDHQRRMDLIEKLKPTLEGEMRDRCIPSELAWEILDRMTTEQLRSAERMPQQLLLRIRMFVLLIQCEADHPSSLNRIERTREGTSKQRLKATHILETTLRPKLRAQDKLKWEDVLHATNRVPVEEVVRLTRLLDECLNIVADQKDHVEQIEKDINQFDREAITVEDLNSMLMVIEKQSTEELQELLEYAQMLLDFLGMPGTDTWEGFSAPGRPQRVETASSADDASCAGSYKDKLHEMKKRVVEEEASTNEGSHTLLASQADSASLYGNAASSRISSKSAASHGSPVPPVTTLAKPFEALPASAAPLASALAVSAPAVAASATSAPAVAAPTGAVPSHAPLALAASQPRPTLVVAATGPEALASEEYVGTRELLAGSDVTRNATRPRYGNFTERLAQAADAVANGRSIGEEAVDMPNLITAGSSSALPVRRGSKIPTQEENFGELIVGTASAMAKIAEGRAEGRAGPRTHSVPASASASGSDTASVAGTTPSLRGSHPSDDTYAERLAAAAAAIGALQPAAVRLRLDKPQQHEQREEHRQRREWREVDGSVWRRTELLAVSGLRGLELRDVRGRLDVDGVQRASHGTSRSAGCVAGQGGSSLESDGDPASSSSLHGPGSLHRSVLGLNLAVDIDSSSLPTHGRSPNYGRTTNIRDSSGSAAPRLASGRGFSGGSGGGSKDWRSGSTIDEEYSEYSVDSLEGSAHAAVSGVPDSPPGSRGQVRSAPHRTELAGREITTTASSSGSAPNPSARRSIDALRQRLEMEASS